MGVIVLPALRHRIAPNYAGMAAGLDSETAGNAFGVAPMIRPLVNRQLFNRLTILICPLRFSTSTFAQKY